jgi:hypothetical protein
MILEIYYRHYRVPDDHEPVVCREAHAVHLVYYIKQKSEKTDGAHNAQSRDTGNIGYTGRMGQYRMYNPETLATLGTQDRRGNAECTTQRLSGLYIPHCPVGLVYPMLPVSLGCTFCIAPSVFCTQCCHCLWVVHYVPRRFSLTFV